MKTASGGSGRRASWLLFALLGVLGLALALRLWGIGFGLPFIYHPDEPRYVISAQILFKTLDLNPRSLPDISSSAFVYVINALAYVPYYLAGSAAGVFRSVGDVPLPMMLNMGVGQTNMPTTILLSRLVTLIFSVGSVVLVFMIGRRLFASSAIGLVAAVMLAISPTAVYHGRLVTPDTFVLFLVLLAFLGAVGIRESARRFDYALAGVALGCLASAKISGVIIVIPILIAHFQRRGPRGLLDAKFLGMMAACAVAFAVTTPYIFGDPAKVVNDILREGRHYASGHAGMEGDTVAWYIGYLWQTEGLVSVLMVIEILRGLYRKSERTLFLAAYPIVYFVFISTFVVRNDRTLLPLLPFGFLLAASLITGAAKHLMAQPRSRLGIAGLIILVGLALGAPLSRAYTMTAAIAAVDSRETARIWIRDNLPAQSRIAFEAYSPYVDPKRFDVRPVGRIIDHPASWYVENGVEYAVFGMWMFSRFYADPDRYPSEVAQYDMFFNTFELVRRFNDGGYEVRIYRLRT